MSAVVALSPPHAPAALYILAQCFLPPSLLCVLHHVLLFLAVTCRRLTQDFNISRRLETAECFTTALADHQKIFLLDDDERFLFSETIRGLPRRTRLSCERPRLGGDDTDQRG